MKEVFELEASSEQPFLFKSEAENEVRKGARMFSPQRGSRYLPVRRHPRGPSRGPAVRRRFGFAGSLQICPGCGQTDPGSSPDSQAQCGERVRWVQNSLNRILSVDLAVDGVMNPETRNAVRSFQQQQGLPVTGIIGPDTQEALLAATRGQNGGSPVSEEAFFGIPSNFWSPPSRIIDLTSQAEKSQRKGMRDLRKVDTLVLHQMACCFYVKDPLKRFLNHFAPHFAILPDGRILQLHPVEALTWASNDFNTESVAVEFAGNFPDTRGKWWLDQKELQKLNQSQAQAYVAANQNQVTPQQIEAGRYLVQYLINTMGLKKIVAHRQSSNQRDNDPGPDVWYHVGQWAVDNLGLSDGGPSHKKGTGNTIPDLWRNWGKVSKPSTSSPVNPPTSSPVLRYQSRGQAVIDLQTRLNRWLVSQGQTPLVVDGDFGLKVKAAVLAFQRANGLTPDGVVGAQTWSRLGK